MAESSNSSTSDRPINLDGKYKMGAPTLVALIGGVFMAACIFLRIPTASEFEKIIKQHNESLDSHPTLSNNLAAVRVKTDRIEMEMSASKEHQAQTRADVEYIRERVDYVTEQLVRQAVRDEALQHVSPSRARRVANTAVDNVRQGAAPAAAVRGALDDL